MLPLTKEELNSHQDPKVCHICGKKILKNLSKSIGFRKFKDHYHYTLYLNWKFECLGENSEKYKTFPIPLENEVMKIGNKSVTTIPYKK